MSRLLLLTVVLSACTEDPTVHPSVEMTSPVKPESTTELAEDRPVAFLVEDLWGTRVEGADLCWDGGCEPLHEGLVALDLPRDEELALWVEGDGFAVSVYDLRVSSSEDLAFYTLTAISEDDAAWAAVQFGVKFHPNAGVIIRAVASAAGVVPEVDGDALGPFYMDMDGTPQPDATATAPGVGYYLFFDVSPDTWDVLMPGCRQRTTYWGGVFVDCANP